MIDIHANHPAPKRDHSPRAMVPPRHGRTPNYDVIEFRRRLGNEVIAALKADKIEFEFMIPEPSAEAIKIYGPDSIYRGDFLSRDRANVETLMLFETHYVMLLLAHWEAKDKLDLV